MAQGGTISREPPTDCMQDMHYAEFAEDEVMVPDASARLRLPTTQSQALLNAIKEYEASKWKVIGQKVGKPAKVRQAFPGAR